MKLIAKHSIRIGRGKGKESDVVAPNQEFEANEKDAERFLRIGAAYDPAAEEKARKQAELEAKAAAEGKPVGGKKSGGEKSG